MPLTFYNVWYLAFKLQNLIGYLWTIALCYCCGTAAAVLVDEATEYRPRKRGLCWLLCIQCCSTCKDSFLNSNHLNAYVCPMKFVRKQERFQFYFYVRTLTSIKLNNLDSCYFFLSELARFNGKMTYIVVQVVIW